MRNYTNLNVLGLKLISALLTVAMATLTFVGLLTLTNAGAIDGDHMQDATGTNTSVTNQVIRKGWGFMPGNGLFAIEDTPIDYGITFDELPFLIVKFANSRQVIDGAPYDLADCRTTRKVIAAGVDQTTSGFKPILRTPTGLGFPSITNYCYTWIAIGRHDASYEGETDPVFGTWDKSTGISITESQINDLSHTNDADIASMGYIKSYTETDPTVNSLAQATLTCTNGQLAQYSAGSGWDCITLTETDPVWTAASTNYYTKTDMQADGGAQLHWNNLANRPTGLDDGDDNVPTGFMISGSTTIPPAGYTYTGYYVEAKPNNPWATKSSMPTARIALASVAANNKIYAIGGFYVSSGYLSTNEEYDPATNSWVTKSNMPTARQGLVAVAVNNKIYAIGGTSNSGISSTNEEYNPATDSWTTKNSMPTARSFLAAAAVNNKIYAIGGDCSGVCSTNEEYDSATNSWATKSSMPTARSYLTAAVANNRIYAIGGHNGSSDLSTNEEYDPATDSWTTKSSMYTARRLLAAAAVNNKIYGIGGYNGSPLSTNEEYDPARDSWAVENSMPTARHNLATTAVNNKIYVIGGHDVSNFLGTNEEYTPPSLYYVHVKN